MKPEWRGRRWSFRVYVPRLFLAVNAVGCLKGYFIMFSLSFCNWNWLPLTDTFLCIENYTKKKINQSMKFYRFENLNGLVRQLLLTLLDLSRT